VNAKLEAHGCIDGAVSGCLGTGRRGRCARVVNRVHRALTVALADGARATLDDTEFCR
jgi:hypothetical protein